MDGILIVDKPQGMTSHDVVDFIRQRFRLKKVGHAGTLDPIATGVLVMLLGKLTKSSKLFVNDDKEYEATLVLGARSDTGDAGGRVIQSNAPMNFDAEEIGGVFSKFLGEIEQTPPMYSAIKFKGSKLYDLARRGLNVERKSRKVLIHMLNITRMSLPEVQFKVGCSKGTYVRQLCADIGERLGCGAYMSQLKRTRSGRFSIDVAIGFDELKKFKVADLEKRIYNIS